MSFQSGRRSYMRVTGDHMSSSESSIVMGRRFGCPIKIGEYRSLCGSGCTSRVRVWKNGPNLKLGGVLKQVYNAAARAYICVETVCSRLQPRQIYDKFATMHVGIFIPAADQPPIHLRNFQPVFVEQVRRQIKTSQWSLAPFDTVGKSLGFRRLEIFFQRAYIEVPVLAGAAAGAFLMPGDVGRHGDLQ